MGERSLTAPMVGQSAPMVEQLLWARHPWAVRVIGWCLPLRSSHLTDGTQGKLGPKTCFCYSL